MNEIMESRDLSHQQTSRLIIQCEMMLVRTFRVCVAYTSEIKGVVHQKYLHGYLCADHRYGKTLYFYMLDAAQKPPG